MNGCVRCPRCGGLFSEDELAQGLDGTCPRCLAEAALASPAPEEPAPLKSGATFRGLEILDLLGRGGMGRVDAPNLAAQVISGADAVVMWDRRTLARDAVRRGRPCGLPVRGTGSPS
ncbi:MAG: hypothetical protein HYY16_18645 [Planctomycetes bacterium]|nr:hypothetical protein [Planctomycetota bacterium]